MSNEEMKEYAKNLADAFVEYIENKTPYDEHTISQLIILVTELTRRMVNNERD